MPDAVIHPTLHELIAFGLGKLPERAAAAVVAHLESCAACRKAVANVPPDSFLGKVRAASPGGSSFPSSLARAANASNSTSRPAMPAIPSPNIPPELINHPKYRILRELGRGGMGVVYQARHKEMDRQVVIKVINRALLDRPDTLERFRCEVKAAAQLSHSNIVTAYDAEQVGELHMLVMEFVPGQNLAEVLQKKGPLPVANACHYMRQVALGLQHAHERGMVHRDIKPQNLMLTPQGRVKILDFGLAKVLREEVSGTGLTSHNAYMGTPDYCAPEQATDARSADIRADLYSLGCTLYCLLAGRPPFREETVVKTILAHLQNEPQPLPELRPDVPERLWRVLARLLAKEPAQRYQKPIEVVQALAPFVKPGAKPDAKGGSALPPDVGAPGKGTMIEADTGKIKKILREMPAKTPPRVVPAKDEEASPFADLTDTAVAEGSKPSLAAWWKHPGVLAAAVSVSLALILMAVILIKVKVQAPNGDTAKVKESNDDTGKPKPSPGETFIILEIDQPGAKVTVDGEKIRVHVPGDNKPIKIAVEPGIPHKLRVSKEGFEVVSQDIELKSGKSAPIRVRLESVKATPADPPPELPSDRSAAPEVEKPAERPAIKPDGQDFVPLFNGKNLTGWIGDTKDWQALGGIITGRGKPRCPSGIWTTRTFGDFHLRVETTIAEGKNSYIQFRQGSTGWYIVHIDGTTASPGDHMGDLGFCTKGLTHPTPLAQANPVIPFKPGEWFMVEIIAKRAKLTVLVKGKVVATFEDPERRFSSGVIHLVCRGNSKVHFRKVEIKELRPAVEPGKQNDPVAHLNLGNALSAKGDLDGAVTAYRKAIALKPDYAEAYGNLGVALNSEGKPVEAEAAWRKVIALKPDLAMAYSNLGNILSIQGKHAEAEEACRKAITLKPNYAVAYCNLGNALIGQGKPVGAEAAWRKAIALKPDHAEAYYDLGNFLMSQGKLVEAEATYRKTIIRKPDFAEAHCNLGSVLRRQGRFTESLAAYRRGHELG